MLTPEHKETGMTFAGNLLITANQDVDFLNNIIAISRTKERTICEHDIMVKVMRVLTGVLENGFLECFQKAL
jgi:hypothetical protein